MPTEIFLMPCTLAPIYTLQPKGTAPEQNSAACPGVCSISELCTRRPSKMCQVSRALGMTGADKYQSSWLKICQASIKPMLLPSGACKGFQPPYLVVIDHMCQTQGPRAKSVPPGLAMWPAPRCHHCTPLRFHHNDSL
uniref:Uncharacterized protein n=1 Tax=Pipistrellus kuhlii TaxID=59472 RepID=A0A7J7VBC0_PIPKU|nr:hypothetical protein mPipKuh1_008496 [Pipistrellus kuhlii]